LTSKPLVNDRRLLVIKDFLTNKPIVNARRLLFANTFSTSALPWNKKWSNALPWHKGWLLWLRRGCLHAQLT
jgi:hypothetical protein